MSDLLNNRKTNPYLEATVNAVKLADPTGAISSASSILDLKDNGK